MQRNPISEEQIRLIEEDLDFGHRFHAKYAKKEGSDHIASETALSYLSYCVRVYKPRIVLECGAGIGMITDALLSHDCKVEKVVAVEDNDFCLRALKKNLLHHDSSRYSPRGRPLNYKFPFFDV